MKIYIKENDGNELRIPIPTGVILSRPAALWIRRRLEKHGICFTRRQILRMAKILRRFRRKHREWKIIEVEDADGERVDISV